MLVETRNPTPLLKVPEVARWLRIKEITLRKWVCYDKIPYLKVGRCVCFRQEDVERWLSLNNPNKDK